MWDKLKNHTITTSYSNGKGQVRGLCILATRNNKTQHIAHIPEHESNELTQAERKDLAEEVAQFIRNKLSQD